MPHSTILHRPLKSLQPAPVRLKAPPGPYLFLEGKPTTFLDLPAELRIEIYRLILRNVIIHVLPANSPERNAPHALLSTSRQIRSEVLPLMHAFCPIRATITDFDFSGLLMWLSRVPPDGHKMLAKNLALSIRLCTTLKVPGDLPSLRRWLHDRADVCRPQPEWRYSGPQPSNKVANDLRRRVKRMKEMRKQAELKKMVRAVGVVMYD